MELNLRFRYQLFFIKMLIQAVVRQQVLVRAVLHYFAIV
jgi:hypothetical protein